jgi:hypothetical protein
MSGGIVFMLAPWVVLGGSLAAIGYRLRRYRTAERAGRLRLHKRRLPVPSSRPYRPDGHD